MNMPLEPFICDENSETGHHIQEVVNGLIICTRCGQLYGVIKNRVDEYLKQIKMDADGEKSGVKNGIV